MIKFNFSIIIRLIFLTSSTIVVADFDELERVSPSIVSQKLKESPKSIQRLLMAIK